MSISDFARQLHRQEIGCLQVIPYSRYRQRDWMLTGHSYLGHVWTAPPWQELSELLQHWSGAVMCPACLCGGEAAGHNAMRGSGPNRKHAFKDALTHAGSPDPRIDLVCITSSCPRQFLQTSKRRRRCLALPRSGFDATLPCTGVGLLSVTPTLPGATVAPGGTGTAVSNPSGGASTIQQLPTFPSVFSPTAAC